MVLPKLEILKTREQGVPTPSPPSMRKRSISAPCSPALSTLLSPRSKRLTQTRARSHEIRLPRRFDAQFRVIQPDADSPRQLEVQIVWNRHVHLYRCEIRRLFFWMCMLFVLPMLSAFKLPPAGTGRLLRPPDMNTQRLAPFAAAPGGAGGHVVDAVVDELQNIATDTISANTDFGAVANVAQELARFVSSGELSLDSLRSVAGRACLSAAMHKMVGVVAASVATTEVAENMMACVVKIPAVVSTFAL